MNKSGRKSAGARKKPARDQAGPGREEYGGFIGRPDVYSGSRVSSVLSVFT